LFEPGNAAALARSASRLLGSPDERDKLREAGRSAVRRYDWEALIGEIVAVYELVARR
jgi:phosphatidylinositol alpha-mannosyltransferase